MPSPHIIMHVLSVVFRKNPKRQVSQIVEAPLGVQVLQLATAKVQLKIQAFPLGEYGITQPRQLVAELQLLQFTSTQAIQVKADR
jgi:hypothetical protein